MAGPGLRHGVLTMPITRRTVIPNIVPPPAIPGTLLATSGLTSVKWVETIADGQDSVRRTRNGGPCCWQLRLTRRRLVDSRRAVA